MSKVPVSAHTPVMQARVTASRIGNAMSMLLAHDKSSESELSWLIETCDGVLRIAMAHAQECARLWDKENASE